MRNKLGPKKVAALRRKTGLDVVGALTRGGTDHRIDLLLADGSIMCLYRDGLMEKGIYGWRLPDARRE